MRRFVAVAVTVVAAACGGTDLETAAEPEDAVARLLFAGDVMLGRAVAPVAAADGPGLLEAVRHVVTEADVAVANLESPLTERPHESANPNDLTAPPSAAPLLAGAGFDAVGIANNHAGDAGAESVADTVVALTAAGMGVIGVDEPGAGGGLLVVETPGPTVAYLAYDLTGQGTGVARWHREVEQDVTAARARAEIVTVGLHGGGEYRSRPDPGLREVTADLARWGVDVVWAHGAHVRHPVELLDPDGDGRATVAAYGLGNFLFDQDVPGTRKGSILEVMVDRSGVVAYRVGTAEHEDLRVRFVEWEPPPGDVAHLAGGWWRLATSATVGDRRRPAVSGLDRLGDVSSAAVGDVTGDGSDELVVAFRRPYRETAVSRVLAGHDWVDQAGRSAHLGLYRRDDLSQVWVAGSLGRPVAEVAACDGAVAVAYETLDTPGVVAGGAWVWTGFGFAPAVDLPGPARPGCADLDHDGRVDPVLRRSGD